MILPGCQDTGTAIIMGKRGSHVFTDGEIFRFRNSLVLGSDEESLSRGVYNTYTKTNLRYSQVAPTDMFQEVNTGTNLPTQIDLLAINGPEVSNIKSAH